MVAQSHAQSTFQSASMERGVTRLRFLDRLRGWAAVVVLLHHLFVDGLPANSFMAYRALWAKVFFLNGVLAVSVFFVISGISLSIRYLETGDARALGRIAAGRYLRLALPIFAICAVTYALLVSGLIPAAAQRPFPLDQFLAFTPTVEGLLSFSLLKVFVAPLLRKPPVEFPRLDIVPALSGAGGGDLCVGAARARALGVSRLRSRDAALAARLRAHPRRVASCDRVLPDQRFCHGGVTLLRRKRRCVLR
jgi:Acyltransferase family